jgi:thiol-disulfide isomerase/thioredoxin
MNFLVIPVLLLGLVNEGIETKFVPSGVTSKVGGYRPIRSEMNAPADDVKKAPEGLVAPKYGKLTLDDQTWSYILDEPEDSPAKLFIDSNGDGDLTNDPAAQWEAKKAGEFTMHSGSGELDLGDGKIGAINLYRFDPKDPSREVLKNTLLYYTDFGYEVTVDLDGKKFSSFLAGAPSDKTSLSIDRDNNGDISPRRERIVVGKPFNFTGTTYVLNLKENALSLDKASEELPVAPLPPNLAIGQKAIEFSMEDMAGNKVDFPKSFAGKLVMLDFWATWCGPCIGEIPNMKQAYADHHEKGFEILGISFDDKEMAEKIKEFTTEKEMPWAQIYEGKLWDTTLGEMYDVSGIPFVLLIDGDTGEILATARELRGPKLSEFIGKKLEERKK